MTDQTFQTGGTRLDGARFALSRLAYMLADLVVRANRAAVRRRAIQDVRALPDHLLKDIGIDRSEVESVVFYGRRGREQT